MGSVTVTECIDECIYSRENICLFLNALSEYHLKVAAWSVDT